jgi:hypothetical protein
VHLTPDDMAGMYIEQYADMAQWIKDQGKKR